MNFRLLLITIALLASIYSCKNAISSNPKKSSETAVLQKSIQHPKTWQFLFRPQMKSRMGDSLGYLANLNPDSKKLVVYLEGGGACFNPLTCSQNQGKFSASMAKEYLIISTKILLKCTIDGQPKITLPNGA